MFVKLTTVVQFDLMFAVINNPSVNVALISDRPLRIGTFANIP
jgi:hypothetical protein